MKPSFLVRAREWLKDLFDPRPETSPAPSAPPPPGRQRRAREEDGVFLPLAVVAMEEEHLRRRREREEEDEERRSELGLDSDFPEGDDSDLEDFLG